MVQRLIDRIFLWTFSSLLEGAVSVIRLIRGTSRGQD